MQLLCWHTPPKGQLQATWGKHTIPTDDEAGHGLHCYRKKELFMDFYELLWIMLFDFPYAKVDCQSKDVSWFFLFRK